MGIDVTTVFVVTFMLGGVLGALGGAYVAPMVSVAPGFGIEVIVLSFAVAWGVWRITVRRFPLP